jgi:hypothetical protein
MTPVPSSMANAQVCLTRSATMRPDSGANLAIGSARSRSKNPFSRSVDRPVAVFSVANSKVCTMIPGSANIRYACGEPPMAPPNTKVNSSRNISGWMLKSISSNGLCLICTRVRQLSERVCRSPSTGPTCGASEPQSSGYSGTVLSIIVASVAVVMPRSLPARQGRVLRSGGRSASGTPRPGSTRAAIARPPARRGLPAAAPRRASRPPRSPARSRSCC